MSRHPSEQTEKDLLMEILKTNKQKLRHTRLKLSAARQRIRKMNEIIKYQREKILQALRSDDDR